MNNSFVFFLIFFIKSVFNTGSKLIPNNMIIQYTILLTILIVRLWSKRPFGDIHEKVPVGGGIRRPTLTCYGGPLTWRSSNP